MKKVNRKKDILEKIKSILDVQINFTTAQLAKAVGVSEAALYKHFRSKEEMFSALLEDCELELKNSKNIKKLCLDRPHLGALVSGRVSGIRLTEISTLIENIGGLAAKLEGEIVRQHRLQSS